MSSTPRSTNAGVSEREIRNLDDASLGGRIDRSSDLPEVRVIALGRVPSYRLARRRCGLPQARPILPIRAKLFA
jgi:hypothetical protein